MNSKKHLTQFYCKVHFKILQYATKYLVNLIKSILFKAEKYKKRKQKSYQNLLDSIVLAKELRKFYRQSFAWICSADFRSYMNLSYPPLLNPNSINYKNISAKLAWELNLPLPPTYNYIYIRIYACASGAMPVYLRKCGFYLTQSFQDSGFDDYATFLTIYDELRYGGGGQNIVLDLLVHRFSEKFLHLVAKNVSCLIVTRDPIGIMKTLANHTGPVHNKIVRFNMGDDYKQILKHNLKYDNGKTPQVGDFTHNVMETHFATLESCLAHFKDNEKIIIDTADLAENKVYDTMTYLSKKLHFAMPSKNELIDIQNTTLLLHWLNITLELPNDIEITIATPFMINVYYDSNKYEILRGITTNDFKLYIAKNKAEILYQNTLFYESVLEYLRGFSKNLAQMIEAENAKRMSENDILHYFANNGDMRAKYKIMFDKNLTTMRQIAPQIIDSWRYYANFENMARKAR